MRELRQQHSQVERPLRAFENTSNGNHPDDAMIAHEAMLDEAPLLVPAEQSGVNLESLKYLEVAAKLGDGISHHRERLPLSCHAEGPGLHEPLQAANIRQREISAVVDVEIDVQVVRPNAQVDSRGREQIDSRCTDQTECDTNQAQPWEHSKASDGCGLLECSRSADSTQGVIMLRRRKYHRDSQSMQREQIVFVGTSDLSGHFRGKSFPGGRSAGAAAARRRPRADQHLSSPPSARIQVTPFGTAGRGVSHPRSGHPGVRAIRRTYAAEYFFLGDIQTAEGAPWDFCPRHVLRRALDRLESETGLRLLATFEQEFTYSGVAGASVAAL